MGEACHITEDVSLAPSSTAPQGQAYLNILISRNPDGDQLVCPKYLCNQAAYVVSEVSWCKFEMFIVTHIRFLQSLHTLTSCGLWLFKECADCRNISCPLRSVCHVTSHVLVTNAIIL